MGSLITIVSSTHGSMKNKHIHFIQCSIFWRVISECSSSSLTYIAKVALVKLQCPVSITFQNSPLQFSAHTYTEKSRTNLPQVNESNFFCFLDFFEGIVYRILNFLHMDAQRGISRKMKIQTCKCKHDDLIRVHLL